MPTEKDRWTVPRASYHLDPDATAHDLLNDATEWLQYARGLIDLLADLVHESDTLDCARMALSLEAISALMRVGVRCTAQAHATLSWEESGGGQRSQAN